jgi:cell division protein ZapE
VAFAAGAPEALYPKGDGAFEFERTVSRLNEMQGAPWLEQASTETIDAPVAASPQSALD